MACPVSITLAKTVELGRLTGTHTPHIDAVYAVTKLLARTSCS